VTPSFATEVGEANRQFLHFFKADMSQLFDLSIAKPLTLRLPFRIYPSTGAILVMHGGGLPDDQSCGSLGDMGHGSLQLKDIQITPDLLNLIMQMQQLEPKKTTILSRGSWTQAEDDLLVSAVQQLGAKKWTDVAKFVPSRTSKQCRERWFNRLCPEIKHEPFEQWEDEIILQKQKEIGNRWSVIAQHLPGRSTNSIKNRWYSGLRTQHEVLAPLDLSGLGEPLLSRPPMSTDLLPSNDIHISIEPDDRDTNPGSTDL
jgi:hypothetical protein